MEIFYTEGNTILKNSKNNREIGSYIKALLYKFKEQNEFTDLQKLRAR